jgi:YegS/Rv2252/BmrU family lipid kinase
LNKLRKILFIINPIAGTRSKKNIFQLIDAISTEGLFDVEICQTRAQGDATRLAQESDADVVVAVGGDGTVHEVAQGLLGSQKSLGILPCGSGDGLALHLGISRNPKSALHTLLNGKSEPIDYGTINGQQPFFCTVGVGLDAEVAWAFAHAGRRGLWSYISLGWKIWRSSKAQEYVVEIDEKKMAVKAVLITVGNANQWGNQARITSLASVQDGLLDVCIVSPFKTIEIPVLAAKLLSGRIHQSRQVQMSRGKEITIHRQQEGPAHFDGDPYMMGMDIHITVRQAALQVMVPAHHQTI